MNTPEETLQKRKELLAEDIVQETATRAKVASTLTDSLCYE